MRIITSIIILFTLNSGCAHRNQRTATVNVDSTSLSHSDVTNDSLDTLSIRILRYFGMRNLDDFVGLTAQKFIDTIPFVSWEPEFGDEDGIFNAVYVHYAGTDIEVILRMKDSPYEVTLANIQLLKLEPERMLLLKIRRIELYLGNKCVKKSSS